jgi:hypothetical protein
MPTTLSKLIQTYGPISRGTKRDAVVMTAQAALAAAGYRLQPDGIFGETTDYFVRQFQKQHDLTPDGIVGLATAEMLDRPHAYLVETARALTHFSGFPHDDTASLIAFYGTPWLNDALLVNVLVPFPMFYEGAPVKTIRVHTKIVSALNEVLLQIVRLAEKDATILKHVQHFSGSYNYRPVRGSSRLSCHAFGAALDFDAERLPMSHNAVDRAIMPQELVDIFDGAGAFWGGDYRGRKDPMHFQFAHE